MIADQETIEEIAKRGNEALAKIEQQFTENALQINKIEAELAAIRQARQDITDILAKSRGNVICLEDTYRQAIEYAKFAQGTPREDESITAASTAKKDAQSARKALEKLEQESLEAEKSASIRETELSSSLQSLQAEQERLEYEKDGTKAAREQAHLELGKQKHDAYLQAYIEKQLLETGLNMQKINAQIEKNEILVAAQQDLAPWPELQANLQSLKPQEDAISRAIEASLQYAEAYIKTIQSFPTPWPISLPSLRNGFHLLDAIMVPIEEILRGRQSLRDLVYRRDLIRELRDEYRALKSN